MKENKTKRKFLHEKRTYKYYRLILRSKEYITVMSSTVEIKAIN